MDTVFIKGLQLETIIGCYEREKTTPQRIELDIDMAWDNRKAGDTDELAYALDYATVTQHVTDLLQSNQFQLVETLAERIASMIMSDFDVQGVRIRLSKLDAIDITQAVGVEINRGLSF